MRKFDLHILILLIILGLSALAHAETVYGPSGFSATNKNFLTGTYYHLSTRTISLDASAESGKIIIEKQDDSEFERGYLIFNLKVISLKQFLKGSDTSLEISASLKKKNYLTVYFAGDKNAAITVTLEDGVVTDPEPVISSFTASASAIDPGESLTLQWEVENAETVSIDNGIGEVDTTGSVTVSPEASLTYTLTAQGTGGEASASVSVIVNTPAPTVTMEASPTTVEEGDSVTLSWTSENADSCTIEPDIGTVDTSGSMTVYPEETTTYVITAQGTGGETTASATVMVTAPNAAPVASISPEIETIVQGDSAALTWSTTDADDVHIDNGIGSVSTSGSVTVQPEYTTIYTLTATGPGGSTSVQAEIHVAGFPAEQPKGTFGYMYNDIIPEDSGLDYYDEDRFAIVTGLVLDIDENPIEDVSVTIHNHPEYGTAKTDSEGRYALPVEGGGYYTVAFQKDGWITSHRKADVPWNDFAVTETVLMVEADTANTTITFDGNADSVFTHQSTLISDDAGTRSATLVFSGDNAAYLVDENGDDVQELSTITVRATEYTEPDAMPADLPPSSAFTYCVELGVDGAERVRFEKPVVLWVDNFLGFDVGDVVPVGYYDRDSGVWVPSYDGLVVQLLDTNDDGVVDALDADGDGAADDFDGDGIFEDEVAGLDESSRYAPGASFWISEIDHFTPWDLNWPWGLPEDAIKPNCFDEVSTDEQCEDCKSTTNSYVESRSRTYHEDILISGTDISLHYSSYAANDITITIPASGDEVPASLVGIIVKVSIAGRQYEVSLGPQPNQSAEIIWDQMDSIGNRVYSETNMRYQVGFQYNLKYYKSRSDLYRSFSQYRSSELSFVTSSKTATVWRSFGTIIYPTSTSPDEMIANGWTVSNHHQLPLSGEDRLLKGDGSVLETIVERYKYNYLAKGSVVSVVAGGGELMAEEGYPATDFDLGEIAGLKVDSTGNLFVLSYTYSSVFKVDTEGYISVVAGTGTAGFSGDGGPAVEAMLDSPLGIDIDADGNIFIADTGNYRIRKIDKDGIITTIAGSDTYNTEDDIMATEAYLIEPVSVATDIFGSVYICDNNRIRKIDPGGIITTVAGDLSLFGSYSYDDTPVSEAILMFPNKIACDEKGNIYFTDATGKLNRIDASGLVNDFYWVDYEDYDFIVDENGNIYCPQYGSFIMMVSSDGTSTGMPDPINEDFSMGLDFASLAFDPDGNLYVATNRLVGKVEGVGSSIEYQSIGGDVYTESNGLGYVMSEDRLHVSTIDLKTGVVLYSFDYDSDDNLISITDQFDNLTEIIRDQNGIPYEIVSPDGLITSLTVDDSENLTEINLPDGNSYQFEYNEDGSMTAEVEPGGNRFEHTYNNGGKITDVIDEEGGHWQYDNWVSASGTVTTTVTTGEGNVVIYEDQYESSEGQYTVITDENGWQTYFENDYLSNTIYKALPCGTDLQFEYGYDTEYNYKIMNAYIESLPSGLSKTINFEKTYQDTDSDWVMDIFIDTVSTNGNDTSIVQNIITGTKIITSPENRTVTMMYDPDTLLTKTVSMGGFFDTTYGYDSQGRLISETVGDREISYGYNSDGFLEWINDPEGQTTTYTRDSAGRVTGISRPDGSMIDFIYDANGNMTVLTNPNSIDHEFSYNAVNKPSGYETPLSGSYSYVYDKDRRLTQTYFPSGEQILNVYTNGLLTQIQTPEADIDLTYSNSKVESISSAGETIEYSYDGKLLTDVSLGGTIDGSLSYVYNNDFNVTGFTYAGETESFSYDLDGLLTESSGFTITRNEENGLPESVSGGSATLSREFNGYGEVESSTFDISGTDMIAWSIERDGNGRITEKTETAGGITATYGYTYDAVGRLLTVTKGGTLVEEYEYDANGVRTYEKNTLRGISGKTSTYSDEDHLLSSGSVSYQHDVDGFLTEETDGSETTYYDYSSRGELLSVTLPDDTLIEYVHDPLGRRIAKVVDGTTSEKYVWQGLTTLLAVYDGSDNLLQRFEYADDRMPVTMTQEGVTYYLGYDQVGSLRVVSDSAGNVIKRIYYDSFGNIIADTNEAFDVPFGFAGGLQDPDTGLVRFGYRDYDPNTGRWTAKDPILFAGGDTDLYGYVQNDPVNFVDPIGLKLSAGAQAGLSAVGAAAAFIASTATGNPLAGAAAGALVGGAGAALLGGDWNDVKNNAASGAITGLAGGLFGQLVESAGLAWWSAESLMGFGIDALAYGGDPLFPTPCE